MIKSKISPSQSFLGCSVKNWVMAKRMMVGYLKVSQIRVFCKFSCHSWFALSFGGVFSSILCCKQSSSFSSSSVHVHTEETSGFEIFGKCFIPTGFDFYFGSHNIRFKRITDSFNLYTIKLHEQINILVPMYSRRKKKSHGFTLVFSVFKNDSGIKFHHHDYACCVQKTYVDKKK